MKLAHRELGISRRSLERLVATGALATIKIGRRRLVHERDIAAFIKSARELKRPRN